MPEKSFLEVGKARLELAKWPGQGTPILLLHEGIGSITMWRSFPDELWRRTGRPVIAWARAGHGYSSPAQKPHDPDYMHIEAERAIALLDRLAVPRAHWLGHSDGGSIALISAASAPDRVASLILAAPHIFVEHVTVGAIAATRTTYLETEMPVRFARHHAAADALFWRWNNIWLDQRFRNWSLEALLPAITAPALLIQGESDPYGTMTQIDGIADVLTRTEQLRLADCAHNPHLEYPEAVVSAVADFLARIGHAETGRAS